MIVRSAKAARQGATLGTVLLLMFVVTTLVFALASSSITHLHLSHRSSNSEAALNLAKSAIAVGLEEVLKDREFGVLRKESDLVILEGAAPGSTGRLTFREGTAETWGAGYSSNNFENSGSIAGAGGRLVPGNALHLVGLGECNGVSRKVEALFHIPKFPYVVASSGRFNTEGEILIAGVERIEDIPLTGGPSPDSLRPGHVISNSSAGEALKIGPNSKVTGDAKAAGGVRVESGAEILGQIQPNSSPVDLPHYSVREFDPDLTGKLDVHHLDQQTIEKANFEGWVRREGNLIVSEGLHLDSGVLYVNGDLTVSGGVTGLGAVLVAGDTMISGRSALSTDNLAAIISGGNVFLKGSGKESSVFRGLVYADGSLVAEQMTLIGTLLVSGEDSSLVLKDSSVLYSPDSVRIDLLHGARTALRFVSPSGANPGTFVGTKLGDKSSDSKTTIYLSLTADGQFLVYPQGSSEKQGRIASDVSAAMALVRELVANESDEKALTAFDNTTNPKLTRLLAGIQNGEVTPEEPELELLALDPSNLLGLADRIRMLFLREI